MRHTVKFVVLVSYEDKMGGDEHSCTYHSLVVRAGNVQNIHMQCYCSNFELNMGSNAGHLIKPLSCQLKL